MTRLAKVLTPTSRNQLNSEPKVIYQTGETVPESGIYRVLHLAHRLPSEVTLLRDQRFPPCCSCADAVAFEIVQLAPARLERRGRIVLYQLPCLEPEDGEKQRSPETP